MGDDRAVAVAQAWVYVAAFGVFAYGFHKVGAYLGFYPRFFWFQMVAHLLSAMAMALLLTRLGLDTGFRGPRLLAFVVLFSAVGAVGWELTEYFQLWRNLTWWGLDDSLLDLGMDALGVGVVLYTLRTRFRPVIDPTLERPPIGDLLAGEYPGSGDAPP